MVSFWMLKIFNEFICQLLAYIFRASLNVESFCAEWKQAIVARILKKEDKQLMKNYRPVSLIPICVRVFKRRIYNTTFKDLIKNDLISENQVRFKPGDSH